jgi:hypothetical protein
VLLVGIDHYLPNELEKGVFYGPLEGAVRDVEAVEGYLVHGLGVPPGRIDKLTASTPSLPEPPEPRELWPTYENLTAALHRLEERSRPGEQVLVHYSGHGGRAPTVVPQVKGPAGLDECLVPLDIGDSSARYLRDVEIGAWLRRMRSRGVFVTLILDCCHAGGALRKGERLRGIDTVDRTRRPSGSLLADDGELVRAWGGSEGRLEEGGGSFSAAWNGHRPPVQRNARAASSWELDPNGFALLAACSERQKAIEAPLERGGNRGVLSWYLLQALGRLGSLEAQPTYRQLLDVVKAHVAVGRFHQTPMLFGEGDRPLLGRRELPVRWGVNVLETSPGAGERPRQVLLNTGAAQGVGVGARFTLHPLRASTAASPAANPGAGPAVAVVEVVEAGVVTSRARVLERLSQAPLFPGDQAAWQSPAPAARRRVRLETRGAAPGAVAALGRLREALEASPWLAPAGWGDAAGLRVGLGPGGSFEVRGAAGAPLEHLGPPLAAEAEGAVPRLLARLEHLARFQTLRDLQPGETGPEADPKAGPGLAGKLDLRLERLPGGYQPEQLGGAVPFDPPGGPYEAAVGEWVQLRVVNRSVEELCVAVLDLQPDWGVSQVHPSVHGGDFETVEPGGAARVALQACLPEGLAHGADTLKVVATTAPVSWRWLELPALAELDETRAVLRGGGNGAAGPGRSVAAVPPEAAEAAVFLPGGEHDAWGTAAVELTVVRR